MPQVIWVPPNSALLAGRVDVCYLSRLLRSLLPFIPTHNLDLVTAACADNLKYSYDADMLHHTWSTLARIAGNTDSLSACRCFMPTSAEARCASSRAPNPATLEESQRRLAGADGGSDGVGFERRPLTAQDGGRNQSVLETTLELVRCCEKSVLLHGDAMLAMLDFLYTVLHFLTDPQEGWVRAVLQALLQMTCDTLANPASSYLQHDWARELVLLLLTAPADSTSLRI